jgi:hypothetical protein
MNMRQWVIMNQKDQMGSKASMRRRNMRERMERVERTEDGEDGEGDGDMSASGNVTMVVVPVAPATQDGGKLGSIVTGSLNKGECTSEAALSSSSSTTPVTVASSTLHPTPSLPTNNTSSAPSEKPP